MNHCAIQKNSFSACEEIWGGNATVAATRSEKKETMVCPKPRRVGLIHTTPARPLMRWHMSHQLDDSDVKAGNELLDIILAKGGCGADQSVSNIASSPPFFSGSPPSRVSNPLIQDAHFGDEKFTPVSPRAIPVPSGLLAPSPSSNRSKVGCVRVNFGNNPAVRIEGFEDRRNCSILTLA